MRISGQFLLLLCCLTLTASVVGAQGAGPPSAPAPSSNAPLKYFLRMQRVRYMDTACVLVRQDGQYQLEQKGGSNAKVFQGSLSASALNNLWIMLNPDELTNLTQDKIPMPPFESAGIDLLVIGIGRPGHWQNLTLGSDGQKRFRKSIGPLMSWFNQLQKAPHVQLTANAGNNCTPPEEPEANHHTSGLPSDVNFQPPGEVFPITPPIASSPDTVQSPPVNDAKPRAIQNFFLLRMVED